MNTIGSAAPTIWVGDSQHSKSVKFGLSLMIEILIPSQPSHAQGVQSAMAAVISSAVSSGIMPQDEISWQNHTCSKVSKGPATLYSLQFFDSCHIAQDDGS
jgi:hypothetical protein